MDKTTTFVLIHSPLVGPLTWQPVRDELQRRGLEAVTPALKDDPTASLPYWQQHGESFAQGLSRLPADQRLVLVAHSGSGPLLPILRQSLAQPIHTYVFVDAGLPRHNHTRLDLMRLEDPAWAEQFHQTLLQGERFPTWSEEDLREIIPDAALRRQLAAEIVPRPLSFFTEPLPVFSGWPDAPCAYIKFSTPYNWDFAQAQQAGWPALELNAGHFHMLVDPAAVTDIIVEAVELSGG